MNESFKRLFQTEKEEMYEDVKKIYAQIADNASQRSIDEIVRVMTVEEARLMNNYCVTIRNKVEKLSKNFLIENGLSDDASEILWSKVRLATGTPKIELCKEIPIEAEQPSEKLRNKKKKTHYGTIITVSGAALEVIGWIFIPGLKTIAAITKALGIVLIVAGVYTMYKEHGEAKPRITLTDSAKTAKVRKTAESISEKQIELNTHILSEWMDMVADVLYTEYKRKMEEDI